MAVSRKKEGGVSQTPFSPAVDLEGDFGKDAPDIDELSSISAKVKEAAVLARQIENLEEQLKTQRAELHQLTTKTLPDLMDSAGTSEFKTPDGLKVSVRDFINGSLPKEDANRIAALSWLEKNGARDLIKTSFALSLGRGQKDAAQELTAALAELGLDYSRKEDVHAQTLYAFARERMKSGEELPIELLGLYVGRVAKIELPVI